ncbi:MAG: hypothetical protein M3H12_04430 [Chromatiales bacterium]
MATSSLYDKIKSNVEELSARDSTIVAITTEYFELADDIIEIRPYDHPMLEFFEMMVAVQLLAMKIAILLGNCGYAAQSGQERDSGVVVV